MKKVIFLALYPLGTAPSQRFRFEQYLPYLTEVGIKWHVEPFYDAAAWQLIYQKGRTLAKALAVLRCVLRRLLFLPKVLGYDFVFVQRGAMPVGPPVVEWICAKIFRKKIVFDFDDAVWMPDINIDSRGKWYKFYGKTGQIARLAHRTAAGNDYLADYARQFSPRVQVIPTVVDTEKVFNRTKNHELTAQPNTEFPISNSKIVLGWTGSHTTLLHLDIILPALRELEREFDFEFLVIANRPPEFELRSLRFQNWCEETEVADLLQMDIGFMPLADNDWTRGKCGFKAIQYMALGIPALVSPVGVNPKIVDDGANGYVCGDTETWVARARELMLDLEKRRAFGAAARQKIVENYSLASQREAFLKLFA